MPQTRGGSPVWTGAGRGERRGRDTSREQQFGPSRWLLRVILRHQSVQLKHQAPPTICAARTGKPGWYRQLGVPCIENQKLGWIAGQLWDGMGRDGEAMWACGTSSKQQQQQPQASSRTQAALGPLGPARLAVAMACLGAAQSSAQMWEIIWLTHHEITSPGLICPSFSRSPGSLDILLLLAH